MVAAFVRDVTEERRRVALLKSETEMSNNLLLAMMPSQVAAKLKRSNLPIWNEHSCASILFADIVGLTPWSRSLKSEDLVLQLHEFFSKIDEICVRPDLKVDRIKLIGDSCLCVTGVLDGEGGSDNGGRNGARRICQAALEFIRVAADHGRQIRVGIQSGPIVSGVIGGPSKFAFDVWGEAVNLASRLESNARPMTILCSRDTYELEYDIFDWEERQIFAKGIGNLTTYELRPLAMAGSVAAGEY